MEWAKGTGLIVQISEPTAQSTVTAETLGADGQAFFSANGLFGSRLDSAISGMLEAEGQNGALVKEVVATRYGGDREKFTEAVRAQWFARLKGATTNPTDQSYLSANGLTVTQGETGLEVQIDDDKAPALISREVLRFAQRAKTQ